MVAQVGWCAQQFGIGAQVDAISRIIALYVRRRIQLAGGTAAIQCARFHLLFCVIVAIQHARRTDTMEECFERILGGR